MTFPFHVCVACSKLSSNIKTLIPLAWFWCTCLEMGNDACEGAAEGALAVERALQVHVLAL